MFLRKDVSARRMWSRYMRQIFAVDNAGSHFRSRRKWCILSRLSERPGISKSGREWMGRCGRRCDFLELSHLDDRLVRPSRLFHRK